MMTNAPNVRVTRTPPRGALPLRAGKGTLREKLQEAFELFDLDGNGYLLQVRWPSGHEAWA